MNPLVSEKKDNPPILVVDRVGIIGSSLSEKFSGDAQTVLVSERQPNLDNIIFVPFTKKFPVIPDSVYSHIFVIDDEDSITRESFSSFLRKAQNDKSIMVIVTRIKNQSVINSEILQYKGSRVVFYGDVIDKKIVESSLPFKFINQAKTKGKINVPGDGMEIIYPLFFEDLILGILEGAFGTSLERIYYAVPKHGVTLLSFSHMIQKSNPSIGIDFVRSQERENISILKEGKYLLPADYPLEDKIRNLNIEIMKFSKSFDEAGKDEKNYHGEKRILRTTFFFLALFIFMPLISTLSLLLFGTLFINSAKISLNGADFDNANKSINISKGIFEFSKKTSSLLVLETGGIGLSKSLETASIEGYKISLGIGDFFQGAEFLRDNKTSQAIESFKNFLIFVQNQKASNKNLDFFNDGLFNLAAATVDVWPQILGFDSKKNYLVLFQNNLKLRSSGGLIESYGILTINKGRIGNFVVKNAYASGQNLKGHIEPPFPIRRYLGQTSWFLKDSNFDVDFRQVASSSAFFVNLETGEKIDGVIAIDFNFIKSILKTTGPLFIAEYKESINSENLFSQAKVHFADKNFSTVLLNSVKTNFENKKVSFLTLIKSVGQAIEQKDLMVASSDQTVQNIFTVNNLSDSLWDGRDVSPKNINDFVGVSEANLGSFPNDLVTRKISKSLEVKENGEISSKIVLELKNEGNDYKNYLRFILPIGAQVKTIKIDGVEKGLVNATTDPAIYEANNFKAPSELEIESYEQEGKTIVGFLILVPRGKSQTIELFFDQSKKPPLDSLGSFSYSLHFDKQPGVDPYPFDFSLSFPKTWRVLNFPKGVNGNDGSISFSKNVSGDFELNLDFSQK